MKPSSFRLAAGVPLAVAVAAISHSAWAQQPATGAPTQRAALEEIVVTAQRISQSVSEIGMSIATATGDQLTDLGIQDTSDLVKIVPGFNHTYTIYGTPVYSIRGVGFLETTLSAGPTVSIYTDEVPIPFSAQTRGTNLDVSRVEVLKGPQGTLYGLNSTGGAINYIANKPTDANEAGFDVSYGRFNEVDAQGFVSGPLADTLRGRAALRFTRSDGWQQSYTRSDSLGKKDFLNGRVMLEWEPTDRLRTLLTLSGWHDQSETVAPQFIEPQLRSPNAQLLPDDFLNYPAAPNDTRAADWDPDRDYQQDNWMFLGSLRVDYDLTPDTVLTSLTSRQRFRRDQKLEGDGTVFENYYSEQTGEVDSWYQELRLTGAFNGEGNWILGANFSRDETFDTFHQFYGDATSAVVLGVLGPDSQPVTWQDIDTYGVFANAEYPVSDTITVQAGVRYTEADRDFMGCSLDTADPANPGWAGQSEVIQSVLRSLQGLSGFTPVGPGECGTMGPPPEFEPGMVFDNLKEDNVSWRLNVNWYPNPDSLLYANVSRGYKAGSFPTLAIALSSQFEPVVQEELLAYEAGFKVTLLEGLLQLEAAAFYYDYEDKQILGSVLDPVFGPLPALVNVPKSNVVGWEASAVWSPLEGLRIAPSISYQDSTVEGSFVDFNSLGQPEDFGGNSFPVAPKVQASLDVQYDWELDQGWSAFVGANATYQDSTQAAFGSDDRFNIPSYTLVDLRAGVERGPWRFSAWGRNVTDEFYLNNVSFSADSMVRYQGMPRTYGISVRYRTP